MAAGDDIRWRIARPRSSHRGAGSHRGTYDHGPDWRGGCAGGGRDGVFSHRSRSGGLSRNWFLRRASTGDRDPHISCVSVRRRRTCLHPTPASVSRACVSEASDASPCRGERLRDSSRFPMHAAPGSWEAASLRSLKLTDRWTGTELRATFSTPELGTPPPPCYRPDDRIVDDASIPPRRTRR